MDEYIYDFLKGITPTQRDQYLKALRRVCMNKKTIQQYKKMIEELNKSDATKK